MRKSALFASLLAVTLLSCGGQDFNKPWHLDKPRILAVRADPPQPSFGQTTTLSALLYQPPAERVAQQCPTPGPVRYQWEWCPIPMMANQEQDRYVCPFPEAQLQALYAGLGLGAPPPFHLGEGETMTFTNPFPAAVLYALCRNDFASLAGGTPGASGPDAGMDKTPFSCDLPATDLLDRTGTPGASQTHPISLNITVMVSITPACPQLLPDGFSPLTATYSLHLPAQDGIPGNQNPVISGIFATENYDPPTGGAPPGPPGDDAAAGSSDDGGSPSLPSADGGLPSDDGGAASADGGAGSDDGGSPAQADAGQVGPDMGHDAPDGAVPLEEDPSVTVKRDKHVGLQLDIDIGTAEHLSVPSTIDIDYVAKNAGKPTVRYFEHLAFSWYSEAGDFNGKLGRNTGYTPAGVLYGQDTGQPSPDDIIQFQDNLANRLDPPRHEDYGYDTARIIVVVRDGRGGVGWTTRQVRLEPTP